MSIQFGPTNKVVKLCLQGMATEANGEIEEASNIFNKALNDAENDFEKYLAAYFIAKNKQDNLEKLEWFKKSLNIALTINDISVTSALPRIYRDISECYEKISDFNNSKKYSELSQQYNSGLSETGPFYHGTKADLQVGDLLVAGGNSNYKDDFIMNHIYFTAIANSAGLAASLAKGNTSERVYIVEPTGEYENDPNVTNVKFPGNPTRSYRSLSPLKIIGEVTDWNKKDDSDLEQWKEKVKSGNGEIIN